MGGLTGLFKGAREKISTRAVGVPLPGRDCQHHWRPAANMLNLKEKACQMGKLALTFPVVDL
jgi:hypothetical protein